MIGPVLTLCRVFDEERPNQLHLIEVRSPLVSWALVLEPFKALPESAEAHEAERHPFQSGFLVGVAPASDECDVFGCRSSLDGVEKRTQSAAAVAALLEQIVGVLLVFKNAQLRQRVSVIFDCPLASGLDPIIWMFMYPFGPMNPREVLPQLVDPIVWRSLPLRSP